MGGRDHSGAQSSNCSESSQCHDVIRLIHYDMCFVVCRSQPLNWYSAADHCRSLDAEITPLLIADVHDALVDRISTLPSPAAESEYWIGLSRARWIWNDTGQLHSPARRYYYYQQGGIRGRLGSMDQRIYDFNFFPVSRTDQL